MDHAGKIDAALLEETFSEFSSNSSDYRQGGGGLQGLVDKFESGLGPAASPETLATQVGVCTFECVDAFR